MLGDLKFPQRWRYIFSGLWRSESSRVLRNAGILPHHYTASQPRRPRHRIFIAV